ncbi:hypothetical protein QFC19_001019 [Naganishia cerealis]|uniref:Uncharacterized protein n=1 Tax=Naganishia cerealis TaxID=610337 RepID=A0ACC2WKP5_9TREE|nr:hypothetical protein QFC19_001019 [Naganishia cerealis]
MSLTKEWMGTSLEGIETGATYNRKYNPQLEAPPTRFGIRPRYNPAQPSCFTQSFNAEYTAVPNLGFVDVTAGDFARLAAASAVDRGDVVETDAAFERVGAVGRELLAS